MIDLRKSPSWIRRVALTAFAHYVCDTASAEEVELVESIPEPHRSEAIRIVTEARDLLAYEIDDGR